MLAAGVAGVSGWSLADLLDVALAWTMAELPPASPSPGSVQVRLRYLQEFETRYGAQELAAWEARNAGSLTPRPDPEEGSNGSFWIKASLWRRAIEVAGLEVRAPPLPSAHRAWRLRTQMPWPPPDLPGHVRSLRAPVPAGLGVP